MDKTENNSDLKMKNRVEKILALTDPDEAQRQLDALPAKKIAGILQGFLCRADENIKWRAIIALGRATAGLADKDLEAARNVMRRLMWSLNDESGGIGWGAAEAMAEAMARHQGLAREFAHILVSFIMPEGQYLEYEPLQKGAIWGIGRLAQKNPDLVRDAAPFLIPLLQSRDAGVRGVAAWVWGLIAAASLPIKEKRRGSFLLEKLLGDDAEFGLYRDKALGAFRVSDLAREALERTKDDT